MSGPKRHPPQIFDQYRRSRFSARDHDILDVVNGFGVAAATHHVFRTRKLDEASADIVISVADGVDDFGKGNVVGDERVGVDHDLILFLKPADRSHFRDAGNRLEPIAQRPILKAPQFRQVMNARFIDQGILIDPAHAGRVRPEFRADAFRKARLDLRKIFEHAASGPVKISAVLEDDVDVRIAEVRETADGFDLGRPQHRSDDGVSDLVFDDVGATIPA